MKILHRDFHATEASFGMIGAQTDPRLLGQALDLLWRLWRLVTDAQDRPTTAELVQRGLHVRGTSELPTVEEHDEMTRLLEQDHALVHGDDPHEPPEFQNSG